MGIIAEHNPQLPHPTWEWEDLHLIAYGIVTKAYPNQWIDVSIREVKMTRRPAYAIYVRTKGAKRGRWIATIVPFQSLSSN